MQPHAGTISAIGYDVGREMVQALLRALEQSKPGDKHHRFATKHLAIYRGVAVPRSAWRES